MTTHYLDEAERLCDRIAIVDDGRIVACDAPANLLGALGDEALELRVDQPGQAEATLLGAGVQSADLLVIGTTLTVLLRDHIPETLVAALRERGLVLRAVTTRRPTFDDVYLRLTGGRIDAA